MGSDHSRNTSEPAENGKPTDPGLQERYRCLARAIRDGMFVLDADGCITEFCARRPEVFPVRAEQASRVPLRLTDVFPESVAVSLSQAAEAARRDGGPRTVSYPLESGGRIFGFEAVLEPFIGDTVLTVIRDVTREYRAEGELLAAKEKYEQLVSFIPDAVYSFEVDAAGNLEKGYVSPQATDVTGLPEDAFRAGIPGLRKYVHPEDKDSVDEALEELRARRVNYAERDYRHVTPDGAVRWVRNRACSRPMPAGRLRVDGTLSDITARKRAEHEMDEMRDRLHQAEKMHAVGRLAGGIAHDFNNQLAGITFFGELLKRCALEPEKIERYAEMMLERSRHSSELTRKLLAFSRRERAESVTLDVHRIIGDMLEIFSHAMGRNIDIEHRFGADVSIVDGDPAQIENAILNVALNARDAMPSGGVFRVTTSSEILDEEACRTSSFDLQPGPFIRITLEDTGCGMDEETRNRMFEPFFTTKTRGHGTGLGLASVYGAVESHGGAVEVESHEGQGTRFAILLPVVANPVAARLPEADGVVAGSGRIVLVDDEDMFRMLAADVLQRLGYDVVPFSNGMEAVSYYRHHWHEVDAVILDVVMPKMDGRETFAEMRKINPGIIALGITGYTDGSVPRMMLEDGVKTFLRKPLQITELSRKLSKCLGCSPS